MAEMISDISRKTERITVDGHELIVSLPHGYSNENARYSIVYMLDGDVLKDVIASFAAKFDFPIVIVGIVPQDRMAQYTPWPAAALRSGDSGFGGEGDEYLRSIDETLIPYICTKFNVSPLPQHTALLGYSLGGLLSLYSLYRTESFGAVASVSGSLWYADWTEFVTNNTVRNTAVQIYISSGMDEGHGAKGIIRNAAAATVQTFDVLRAQYPDGAILLEWNKHSHHKQIELKVHTALSRLSKAIREV